MKWTVENSVSRILTEDVLTLSEAKKELASITGLRPDKATMTRWIHRGVGGIKLEAVRLGVQLLTSRQALNEVHRSANRKFSRGWR